MKDREYRVRKSNNLVQAKFRLKTNEYRLLLYCAAKIKPMTSDVSRTFRIYGQEYAEMYGIALNNAYKQIREGLDSTWDREFYEWLPHGKGQEPGWKRRRFVITQEYNPSEGYGAIELHPDFLRHLIDLREQYTDYALRNVQHLRSFSTMRLYELLAQYRKLGQRYFDVQWFREIMSLEDSYPRFSDLRKHILEPSLKSITENTDIEVIRNDKKQWVTAFKKGRATTGFEIHFRHKMQQALDLEPEPDLDFVPEQPVPEWQALGYATAGEYREACSLENRFGVSFDNARDFLVHRDNVRQFGVKKPHE